MRIVVRNSPGQHLADLTETDAAALRAWYGNSASEIDEHIAFSIIKSAKVMDGWIECDCIAGRFRPLMAPIQQERTFTLRRLTPKYGQPSSQYERPNHAEICPFHVDKDETPSLSDRTYHLRPFPKSDRSYVDALPAMPTRLAEISATGSLRTAERNDRPSKLGAILWRLIDRAEINIIEPLQENAGSDLAGQIARLRSAARDMRVVRKWTMNALMSTWAEDYWNAGSRWQGLLEASRPDWPDSLRRTGFMLLFSKSVSSHTVTPVSTSKPINLHAKVRQPLRGDPARRGPFLTLMNVDFGDDDESAVRAVQAYAQPVYDRDTLFPVESDFERDVLHMLLWLQKTLFEAAPDLSLKIIKPLFAWETPDGPCRPDFNLELKLSGAEPSRLVIEAFGMDTEEYRLAKDKTVPRMRHIGPVFGVRPADLTKANATQTGERLLNWILANAME